MEEARDGTSEQNKWGAHPRSRRSVCTVQVAAERQRGRGGNSQQPTESTTERARVGRSW